MKSFKLENPIKVNGKDITELTYDPQKITASQFSEACARSADLSKSKTFTFKARENDYSLHLYLGMMSVIAVNPDVDVSDLERCTGYDTLTLADIGMLFTLRRSGVTSGESSSDAQSETTPKPTAQA